MTSSSKSLALFSPLCGLFLPLLLLLTPLSASGQTPALEAKKRICDKQVATVCFDLAQDFLQGRGVEKDLSFANVYLEKACSLGELHACYELGKSYELGQGGLPQEISTALTLYTKACSGGVTSACKELGHLYYAKDRGVPQDFAKSFTFFKRACDLKDASACRILGHHHEYGYHTPKNLTAATALYKHSCTLKDIYGCQDFATNVYHGWGVKQNLRLANGLFNTLCIMRDLERSCYMLGKNYQNGVGVPKADLQKAIFLFKKACNLGDRNACNVLGTLYYQGQGVATDKTKAKNLYAKSCNAKHKIACSNLGEVLREEKDYLGAVMKLETSCDADYLPACAYLANILDKGQPGVPAQPKRALSLYERSCEANVGYGCNKLGRRYEASKNIQRAIKAYRRGCEANDGESCFNLGVLTKRQNPESEKPYMAHYDKACKLSYAPACHTVGIKHQQHARYPKALREYIKGCRLKHADSCYNAAHLVSWTQNHEAETKVVQDLNEESCQQANPKACFIAGKLWFLTQPKSRLETASLWFEKGCELEHPRSCAQIPTLQVQFKESKAQGVRSLKSQCQQGNKYACKHLGFFLRHGKFVPKDLASSLAFYQQGCNLRDATSCQAASHAYEHGLGTSKDPVEAFTWAKKSCGTKSLSQCFYMARFQRLGIGTRVNLTEAHAIYAHSCHRENNSAACNMLGWAAEQGQLGQPQDIKKAYTFYRQACYDSWGHRCRELGKFHRSGPDKYYKPKLAAKLFEKECTQKRDGHSCHELAQMYGKGEGVGRDIKRGEVLLKKACDLGHTPACPAP